MAGFGKKHVLGALGADEAGVKAAGDSRVGGAFYDGAAVREKSHFIFVPPELQHEVIVLHAAMRRQAGVHLRE